MDEQPIKYLKLKPGVKIYRFNPSKSLADPDFMARAIWDCLKGNDLRTAADFLRTHHRVVKRLKYERSLKRRDRT